MVHSVCRVQLKPHSEFVDAGEREGTHVAVQQRVWRVEGRQDVGLHQPVRRREEAVPAVICTTTYTA